MDERTALYLSILGGSGYFAVLGSLFGSLVGWIHSGQGYQSGTAVGLAVARAYDRLAPKGLSDTVRGMVTGGSDGLVIGAGFGLVLSLLAARYAPEGWQYLLTIGWGSAILAMAALALGLLAGLLTSLGTHAVAGLFFGGVLGGLLGLTWRGTDGLMVGVASGSVGGVLLIWAMVPRQNPSSRCDEEPPEG
jgi:hypothetical protein